MKWYRGPDGGRRVWYAPDEIEQLAENELENAGLMPSLASPVVDIEALLERHLGAVLDQYSDLGSEVLGATQFAPGKAPRVLINRDLTAMALDQVPPEPGRYGRWRATVAHEAGHIIFHRILFETSEDQITLFEIDTTPPKSPELMRCLNRTVSFSNPVADWREVQANRAMAALLMPRRIFGELARTDLRGSRTPEMGTQSANQLASGMAVRFGVSRQAAFIRLATLGLVRPLGALHLPLDNC